MFVLLGTFWYIVDRRFGVKWYRRWHNLTNKNPLPTDVEVGFIYNRKSRHKALMAGVLSTVQTVLALFSMESINLLVELILWIVEVPMTMLGFLIGPWGYKLWLGRGEMFDALDEINAKSQPEDEKAEEPVEEKAPEPEPEPEPEPKDDPEDDDPRDMMSRYTDKR